MSDGKCDVVFVRVAQGIDPVCRSLSFGALFDVGVKMDTGLLWLVASPDVKISDDLKGYTNCCWVNVVMQVVYYLGRRLSVSDSNELIKMVHFANSRTQSVTDTMKGIITRLDLPVTFVEYYNKDSMGTVIGNINGPAVCCVLRSSHYNLWLPAGSTLAGHFRSANAIVKTSHPSKSPKDHASSNIHAKRMLEDSALARRLGDVEAERKAGHCRDEVRKLAQTQADEAHARTLVADNAERKAVYDRDEEYAHMLGDVEAERKAGHCRDEVRKLSQTQADEAYARTL
jgi:hypothetical protein